MENQVIVWTLFNLFVLAMLALDLGVFHRRTHAVEIKEALIWSAVWIALALLFNVLIYFWQGPAKALEYFTGYLIEKSLSVDNLFVFIMIFSYFGVRAEYQHKVLFWGIVGALIMRAIFIFTGVALIQKFHWVIYIFGTFLIFTGIRMSVRTEKEVHPEKNPLIRLFRSFMSVTKDYHEDKFFIKKKGKYMATPLVVVLLVVETTDVMFALDSIPAILAITVDPFIVYSSNVFAILGLRALYFALAGIMRMFEYLHYGLAVILVFVGIKMMIAEIYKMPVTLALGVIAVILLSSIILSLVKPSRPKDLTEMEEVNKQEISE